MSLQIDFVTDAVLPEPGLPQVVSAGVGCAADSVRACLFSRELGLDGSPTPGIVGVAFGQRPDRMKMVGQTNNGDGREGLFVQGLAVGVPQIVNMACQPMRLAIAQRQREEIRSSGLASSAIEHHAPSLFAPDSAVLHPGYGGCGGAVGGVGPGFRCAASGLRHSGVNRTATKKARRVWAAGLLKTGLLGLRVEAATLQ